MFSHVITFQQYETTMDLFWQVIRMTKRVSA
jgi:hypothetical protein